MFMRLDASERAEIIGAYFNLDVTETDGGEACG